MNDNLCPWKPWAMDMVISCNYSASMSELVMLPCLCWNPSFVSSEHNCCRLTGLRVVNIYDIDNKTYLIKFSKYVFILLNTFCKFTDKIICFHALHDVLQAWRVRCMHNIITYLIFIRVDFESFSDLIWKWCSCLSLVVGFTAQSLIGQKEWHPLASPWRYNYIRGGVLVGETAKFWMAILLLILIRIVPNFQ